MKKLICVLIVILMCVGVCGCNTKNNNATDNTDKENISIEETSVIKSRVGGETLQYPAKNEEFEYKVYETYVEISKYIGTDTAVTVPDTIEELAVKSIGDWSFEGCGNITSVKLPDGIIEIGYNSFRECTALKEINIPDGVEKIGEQAFQRCSSLVEITIPKSVKKIGDLAFGLTDAKIKAYKASYAIQYIADNYIDNYEVLE